MFHCDDYLRVHKRHIRVPNPVGGDTDSADTIVVAFIPRQELVSPFLKNDK